jgi:hypothetical protein
MAFVVIYTVGRLRHLYEHPASRDFFDVGYEVYQQASKSGHLIEDFSSTRVPFSKEATIDEDGKRILTLTVWKCLQSLYSFTYSGKHKQALRDRNKWIEPHQDKQPTYVMWWTENSKAVSWEEAFRRYNYYIQHGSTPFGFDFKLAFNEVGEKCLVK